MTSNEEIKRDVAELSNQVAAMSVTFAQVATIAKTVEEIKRMLVGPTDDPGGYIYVVQDNSRRIGEIEKRQMAQEERRGKLVTEYDERVSAVEDWIKALRNKAVGLAIGIPLGSAGIGGAVGAVVSNLLK